MLKPEEISADKIKSGMGGYKKKETEEYVESIRQEYEKICQENTELKEKLSVLSDGVQYYKNMESSLQKALVLAERTTAETVHAAEVKAVAMEQEAKAKAEVIVKEAKLRAEHYEKDASIKADHIIRDAKCQADHIIAQGKEELSKVQVQVSNLLQQYEQYKTQYKQLAMAQMNVLEHGAYVMDPSEWNKDTEPSVAKTQAVEEVRKPARSMPEEEPVRKPMDTFSAEETANRQAVSIAKEDKKDATEEPKQTYVDGRGNVVEVHEFREIGASDKTYDGLDPFADTEEEQQQNDDDWRVPDQGKMSFDAEPKNPADYFKPFESNKNESAKNLAKETYTNDVKKENSFDVDDFDNRNSDMEPFASNRYNSEKTDAKPFDADGFNDKRPDEKPFGANDFSDRSYDASQFDTKEFDPINFRRKEAPKRELNETAFNNTESSAKDFGATDFNRGASSTQNFDVTDFSNAESSVNNFGATSFDRTASSAQGCDDTDLRAKDYNANSFMNNDFCITEEATDNAMDPNASSNLSDIKRIERMQLERLRQEQDESTKRMMRPETSLEPEERAHMGDIQPEQPAAQNDMFASIHTEESSYGGEDILHSLHANDDGNEGISLQDLRRREQENDDRASLSSQNTSMESNYYSNRDAMQQSGLDFHNVTEVTENSLDGAQVQNEEPSLSDYRKKEHFNQFAPDQLSALRSYEKMDEKNSLDYEMDHPSSVGNHSKEYSGFKSFRDFESDL